MTARTRQQLRRDDGAVMVELALVLPVLMLLVLGMLDLGRAYNYWIDETHLANQAARLAAVNASPPGGGSIQAYVRAQASTAELRNGSDSITSPLQVCVSFPSGTSNVGDPVTVEAHATYRWLPFLGLSATQTTITGRATMRLESRPTTYAAGCA